MRAAIVGTGFIAGVHAIALQALGVEVAAVAGRTHERATEFGTGTPYGNLGELLERENVDVLHVCTPNDVHAAQALAAIERGIHVVCEKPLAVSTAESRAMVEAAEERGLVNATCYHARGYPLVEQMRVDVARGTIGEVSFVHGRYLCDDVLFPVSGWRVDPARSGPSYVVGDIGTHWLDLAEHVTGRRVSEVHAEFRSFAGGPLEDYAALLLRLGGDVAGALVLPTEMLMRPADGPRRIVVKDPATNAEEARRLSRYPAGHGEGYGQAFRNLFADVYAAIEGRPHAPYPTFRDGHRGAATVEAAVASARDGGWVSVPGV